MKTATTRDLRNNFAEVSSWVAAGQEVQITKRGIPVAKLVGIPSAPRKPARFDAKKRMKRLREIYGDKILPGNSVLLMREEKNW